MNKKKKIILGATILVVPFSSVAVGAYILYKAVKEKKKEPQSFREFLETLLKEEEKGNK